MIKISKKSNLLETETYKYDLHNPVKPNLYEEMFDYKHIPKVAFNHRLVPKSMPRDIYITDTTFRDGQQAITPYTVEQTVQLYKFLNKLGGPKGIIRQTEFFAYSEKDRKAIEKCRELGFEFPEITTWIRANKEDFKLVRDLGIKETGILLSCSDYHIYKKMGLDRKAAFDKYVGAVKDAFSEGIVPRCHLEDITRADFYGFVVPLVCELERISVEAGIPVKIRACDTMGYGVPFSEAAPPRSVAGIIYGLLYYTDMPSNMIEWHGHNDFYMGVANAATAWLYGAGAVNCSLLGIGERTGNVPLEAMVMQYASLRGTLDGMDTRVITEIAEYYKKELGYDIPPSTPFVGENFNLTRAGIHADGLNKSERIYNIFDTKKLLNRPAGVVITNASGLAGIAYWLNDKYDLTGENMVDKRDEVCVKIKERVDQLFAEGRASAMTDKELESMAEEFAPGRFKKTE